MYDRQTNALVRRRVTYVPALVNIVTGVLRTLASLQAPTRDKEPAEASFLSLDIDA